jgi:integrase
MPRQRFSRPAPKRQGKPAKWYGEWHVYVMVDGKEKRQHRGPKVLGLCSEMTKSEAQEKLDKIIAADRAPKDQRKPDEPETLGWAIRQYLHLGKAQWEPETYGTLKSVSKHLDALGETALGAVTREQLQEHLNALASMSHSTVKKARNILATVFSLALEDGKIARNPMSRVNMPRTRKPSRRFLSEEEFTRLLGASHGRDHLIIRMCGVLGFRPGELFALKWGDVEPGRIRVDESSRNGVWKKPKTEASAGYVALPPSLALELQAWRASDNTSDSSLVFSSEKAGRPIRQNNYLKRVLKPLAERAGIEGVTFQSLRRTTATHVQSVGTVKDAQAMMRHASPEMTVGVYMQSLPDSVRAAAEALDEKLCGRVM